MDNREGGLKISKAELTTLISNLKDAVDDLTNALQSVAGDQLRATILSGNIALDAGSEIVGKVYVTDGVADAAVDGVLSALEIIDITHYQIHKGLMFRTDNIFTAVADDSNGDLLIKVGANKELHVLFCGACGGDAIVYLYETPTITDDGTTIDILNRKRCGTPPTSDAKAYHTPTISDVGTKLLSVMIPGGSGVIFSIGGAACGRFEWIFKKSTNYLLRVTNVSGAAQDIGIDLEWYEVED